MKDDTIGKFVAALAVTNLLLSHYVFYFMTTQILFADAILLISICLRVIIMSDSSTML